MNPLGTGPQSRGDLKRDSQGGNGETWWKRDSEGGDKRLKKGSGNCWLGALFHKVSGVEGRA